MYAEDSFHSLSLAGRIGLVALSLGLAGLLVFASWRLAPRLGPAAGVAFAALLFFLFVWLSPQVYYFYYMTLFDGLPWQAVIKAPPSPVKLLKLLAFQEEATLSAHGKGLLAWCMLLTAAFGERARLWLRTVSGRGSSGDTRSTDGD